MGSINQWSVDSKSRTRYGSVGSANTTSVLCIPPFLFVGKVLQLNQRQFNTENYDFVQRHSQIGTSYDLVLTAYFKKVRLLCESSPIALRTSQGLWQVHHVSDEKNDKVSFDLWIWCFTIKILMQWNNCFVGKCYYGSSLTSCISFLLCHPLPPFLPL